MDGQDNTSLIELSSNIADLEEKNRLMRERVLLIGKNLVESREKNSKDITDLKIAVSEIKEDISKIKAFLLRVSEELEKRARKSEVELLAKQAKMFSPLELVRMEDLKKIIGKK